jgi:glycosyltransferase involved in cell wall biosynthesis
MTSSNDPLVTIAIPTFNRALLLKGCILSALAQSYQNFEVIVLDNASTDETGEVLKQFRDPRLRVVRQKLNVGLLKNWNSCLAEAKGDFFVLLPDDDQITSWMLERCITLVRNEPEIEIVIGLSDNAIASSHKNLPLAYHIEPVARNRRLKTGIWEGTDILKEFLEGRISTNMCSIMLRTETLRARGGFPIDHPYVADMAVWAPILMKGKAGFINAACGIFRTNANGQTARLTVDVRLGDWRTMVDQIANNADLHSDDEQKRDEIKLMFRRGFAREIITILSDYHRAGAKLTEVLPEIWRWRQDLLWIGRGGSLSLIRPFIILVLPTFIISWYQHFMKIYRRTSSCRLEKNLPFESENYYDRPWR